jgi:Phasin protein
MTQEAKGGNGHAEAAASAVQNPFLGVAGPEAAAGWLRVQEGLFREVADLGQETARFTQDQMGVGIEGMSRLAQCRNPGDLLAAQQTLLEAMQANYLDHIRKLGDRMMSMVARGTTDFEAATNGGATNGGGKKAQKGK